MVRNDAWMEFCKIGIIPEEYPTGAGGGSEIQFAALTKEISDLDFGDKPMEGIKLANGGRIAKLTGMDDEKITMKIYPTDALIDDGDATAPAANGVVQLFHPQSAEDVTEPIMVANSIYRRRFGIILLWAETLPATAGAVPATSNAAYRIQIVNAFMTGYKLNYDDKVLSAEITFKWTPFQKDATENKREESTDGNTELPAAITSATSF